VAGRHGTDHSASSDAGDHPPSRSCSKAPTVGNRQGLLQRRGVHPRRSFIFQEGLAGIPLQPRI